MWHGARMGERQPSAGQPAAEQPAAEQPSAEQPSAGQPAAGQPAAEQPSAGQPAAEQSSADAALLAEAATKSDLVWLRPAGQLRAWPAWHVWHAGAVHVVSGGGEQQLPDLGERVDVLVRSKQTSARLITVPTTVHRLDPDDQAWTDAAATLATNRLNSTRPAADLVVLWRSTTAIYRFEVCGPALERPDRYDDASGAGVPAPTAATTSGWRPWHFRGRRRRPTRA